MFQPQDNEEQRESIEDEDSDKDDDIQEEYKFNESI